MGFHLGIYLPDHCCEPPLEHQAKRTSVMGFTFATPNGLGGWGLSWGMQWHCPKVAFDTLPCGHLKKFASQSQHLEFGLKDMRALHSQQLLQRLPVG